MGIVIAKMPSKEMLEAYLAGQFGNVTVIFNLETGRFEKVA